MVGSLEDAKVKRRYRRVKRVCIKGIVSPEKNSLAVEGSDRVIFYICVSLSLNFPKTLRTKPTTSISWRMRICLIN